MLIREATPEDAEQLIAHMQRLTHEPAIDLPWGPGEFNLTVERQRKMIESFAEAPNSIFLVAEVDGEIIGNLDCAGGKLKVHHHVATLGIAINQAWRGQGVGKALMTQVVDWAKSNSHLHRITLEVYATNAPAIRLYERFGFEAEGRNRKAVFKHGEYIDTLSMALLL